MTKRTIVSIIVPCYNLANFLPETLDSVLAQKYTDWECIIVNDGSSDNTEQVALEYCNKDPRFKYLHKENGGLSSARNAGIRESCGDYILPLDSDDKIGSEYLSSAVEVLNSDSEIGIVYCRAMLFGKQKGEWILGDFSINNMLMSNLIFCTAFFRRRDYDRTRGYDENMKYGFEDWDFWLSLLELDVKVYRIDRVLFHYRIRMNSMIRSLTDERSAIAKRQLWENHRKLYACYFLNADPIHSPEYKAIINSKEYKLGRMLLKPLRYILGK